MENTNESLFNSALERYKAGDDINIIKSEFQLITDTHPNHGSAWTCLSWLYLLTDEYTNALSAAKKAFRINPQDPQTRINLSLALLETKSKGVRQHIDFVRQALVFVPDFKEELKNSIEDGITRKPDWNALLKVKNWLQLDN